MAGNIVRGAIIPGGWRNAKGNYGWARRLSVAGGEGDLSVWSHPDQAGGKRRVRLPWRVRCLGFRSEAGFAPIHAAPPNLTSKRDQRERSLRGPDPGFLFCTIIAVIVQ